MHKGVVRIAAGEFKGRVLEYPDRGDLRPTMQKTREAVFSSLGVALRGAVFLDLFAGGGAVGIEALSRGAGFAHFVESSHAALNALRANLTACRVDTASFAVHGGDVPALLQSNATDLSGATVIFADPPYDDVVVQTLIETIEGPRFPKLETFVLEHASRVVVAAPRGLRLTKTRRFGDTTLSTFSPNQG